MLEVRCVERLEATRAFADANGVRAQLEERLDYLANYRQGTCRVELYGDISPHCFTFNLYGPATDLGDRDLWFHGGLIFDTRDNTWSVHT